MKRKRLEKKCLEKCKRRIRWKRKRIWERRKNKRRKRIRNDIKNGIGIKCKYE